jgi:predicted ATPase/class 3 adenylate cyclase
MVRLCTNCGFNNPPGMRFCGNCGSRLVENQATSSGVPVSATPVDSTTEKLGVLMGADLMERLRTAGVEAAGQRRTVTVLFTDLSGFTALSERMDSEDVYDIVQQYIQVLVNNVYKYEGIVDKLTGDGLMALFGAPISHENNAERAVRAALEMQTDILQLNKDIRKKYKANLRMRVGLHSGMVVVGGMGSNMMMDYTAIGDTVNLAHRIEEAAPPNTILVSESVYRQTKSLFEFQQVSALNPKGITHPVVAFSVIQLKTRPGRMRGLEGLRAPMIGRDAELNRLKQVLTDLLQIRRGQFVFITGEAGMGKSRLTAEFKATLNPHEVRVLEAQSLAYRRSIAYWIILNLLYQYLGLPPNTPKGEVHQRLIHAVEQLTEGHGPDTLTYLEHLFSLPYSDLYAADRLRYLDAEQLRQQIFLAVRDLLVAEAHHQPLILILEDLHWADEASLNLLYFLLESLRHAPILIVCISRQVLPGALSRINDWAKTHLNSQFHAVPLQGLSSSQSAQLLFQLLTIPDLPDTLREQILQRAAGIPFYLEEILRMLIDEKIIRRENNHWRVEPKVDVSKLGVPDTLQGLILARFDRLPELERHLLQVASVIGKNFAVPVLQAVLTEPTDEQIPTALDTLVERDFIQPLISGSEAEYTFRHILMSDAIYGTILRKERSKMHGRVGKVIEALYADDLENQVELLANHYLWSTNQDKALYYLTRAGERAAARYANAQAQQHFELALQILPTVKHTLAQALRILSNLGDVLVLVGEYAAARKHYQDALTAIQLEGSERFLIDSCSLQRKIGNTFERQGDYDQAQEYLNQAQQTVDCMPGSQPIEKARILNDMGWINFRRGNLDQAEVQLKGAQALLEKTNQYDVIASIYNRLGGIYYFEDQLDQASIYVRKSLALREEIGDIVAVARSYNNLGLLSWRKGEWESALANFMRSVELHANLGDVEGVMEVNSNLGLLQIDRGNIEQAKKHLDAALSTAQQSGLAYGIGVTYLHFSYLYLSSSDWKSALEYCGRSLAILKEIDDQDHMVEIFTNFGTAWLGLGDLDLARNWANEALRLCEELGAETPQTQSEPRGRALRLLGNICQRNGEYEDAGELIRTSLAIFQNAGNQLEQGRSAHALAILQSQSKDYASARMYFNEARLIFRQLGASLDLESLEDGFAQLAGQ